MEDNMMHFPLEITLPTDVMTILEELNAKGFESYCVGGCVRDLLLRKQPSDWDITTNATPDQVASVFAGNRILPTGIKHGTVTLRLNHISYEITTYRIDGEYSDRRRPDSVYFSASIEEDLARRDFTMNAVAYHHKTGLVDPFGGRESIESKTIVCVGNPVQRFKEDPLRIVRAFRFASTLGFLIEETTQLAMKSLVVDIAKVSVERIQAEINKAIVGMDVTGVFLEYSFILLAIFPELTPMVDVPQNNPHHIYSVWQHSLRSIGFAPKDLVLRLAMLFHDSGKPATHTTDDLAVDHFYSHSYVSETIAKTALLRLRYSNDIIEKVCLLVLYHDIPLIPSKKAVKRWMNRLGKEHIFQLIEVKRADNKAQSPVYYEEKIKNLDHVLVILKDVIKGEECFTLAQLDIDGNDLIALGIPKGKDLGLILQLLLDLVVDEKIENSHAAFVRYLKEEGLC